MKIGVALPHYGSPPNLDRVVRIAVECERLGFDSVWVSDHLVFDLAKYGGSDALLGSLDLEREISKRHAHAAAVLDDERMRVAEGRTDRFHLRSSLARAQHERHSGVAQPLECRSRGVKRVGRVVEQRTIEIGQHEQRRV